MSSWTVFSNNTYGPGDTYTSTEATAAEAAIALAATQGNTHAGASTLDHPDGSVTDAKVGNRTPDDTQTATSGGGTLLKCLSMLANIIKQITGGSHWYSAPATTIAALSSGKLSSAGVSNDGSGNLTITSIASLGGQATAGAAGVPINVAVADGVSVTSTTQQTICSVTPATDGTYRVSLWAYAAGAATSVISAFVSYKSAGSGATHTHNFDMEFFNTFEQLNATSIATPAELVCFPMLIRAKAGAAISVLYHDATATPADSVSAFIERIS